MLFLILCEIVLPGNRDAMIGHGHRHGIGMGHVITLVSVELGQRVVEWDLRHAQVWGEDARLVDTWLTFLLACGDGGGRLRADLGLIERLGRVLSGGGGRGGGGLDRGGVRAGVVGGGTHEAGPWAGAGLSAESLESHLHLLDLREREGWRVCV